jgi:hypothetical protein
MAALARRKESLCVGTSKGLDWHDQMLSVTRITVNRSSVLREWRNVVNLLPFLF